jgi:hypothetical protein
MLFSLILKMTWLQTLMIQVIQSFFYYISRQIVPFAFGYNLVIKGDKGIMAITLELAPEIEARLIAQAATQGISAEAFLKAAIENLLNAQPHVYRVGTALVVQSTPIGNLETSVEQMREERITSLIADYESPV